MSPFAFPRPTALAHTWLTALLRPGDHAVDATLGNGHDALFLAQCVGVEGKVIGFDIQAEALGASSRLLESHGIPPHCYEWHQRSHVFMGECVKQPVKAVMFNLGYLPGADHGVITEVDETLAALYAAERIVQEGGMITIVCYPGHPGGDREKNAVCEWAGRQGDEWHVVHYEKHATLRPAPMLVALQRKERGR
jgi:hypothetical protein